jgi:glutamyl-tRNA reductase
VRERLGLGEHGERLLDAVAAGPDVAEAVGLATCNRCELYLVGEDTDAIRHAALDALALEAGRGRELIEEMVYVRTDGDAAEHLFAVAAGLDSLVPGEAQILAQIRAAYAGARAAATTGPVTNRLFHAALEAGKRARAETAIGAGGASVASVAVDLVRRRLGDLDGVSALLIGAGKVAELVVAQLLARGAGPVAIANRTAGRADALAARFGPRTHAVAWDDLTAGLEGADVVIGSTASREPLVRPDDVPPGRRRIFVDLAVPRDVDPAVAALPGQTVVNVDDLEETVRANIELRHGEADLAWAIVRHEAAGFRAWLAALEVVPAITGLRALAEGIRAAELERMEGKWESLSADDRRRVENVTRGILNKLLHRPTVRLKELASESPDDDYARAVSELFGLR